MTNEELKDVHFPKAGIDLGSAFDKQPNRNIGPGKSNYARTTPVGENVRGFESSTNRKRGGSRPGLSKFISVPVVAGWIIQELAAMVTTDNAAEV